MIVGIDPSLTNTGVVAIDNNLVCSHNVCFTPSKNLFGIERLLFLANAVRDFVDKLAPDVELVSVEGPSYGSKTSSLFELGELGGLIQLTLYQLCVSYVFPAPTEVKKLMTGKGNADKDKVKESVGLTFDIEGKNYTEHEIDALAIAFYGRAFLKALKKEGPRVPLLDNIEVKSGIAKRTSKMKGKVINPKFSFTTSLQELLKSS